MSENNKLSFQQICNKKAIVIDYIDEPGYTDIKVSDNKLLKRSDAKRPFTKSSDKVGDTELITTFLESRKITDVTLINFWDNLFSIEDVSIRQTVCGSGSRALYQCVPPHMYAPRYIWTAPQPRQGLTM